MKAEKLIDAFIEQPNASIVIELHNGQRIPTADYIHDDNVRGEAIIVIRAGTPTNRSQKNECI